MVYYYIPNTNTGTSSNSTYISWSEINALIQQLEMLKAQQDIQKAAIKEPTPKPKRELIQL